MSTHVSQAKERGSALLFVVVIMLVLSVTGVALLTKTEENRDETYGTMYAKDALAAAETGLRQGEEILFSSGSVAADILLAHSSSTATTVVTPVVPVFPQRTWEYDLAHLGTYLTVGNTEMANMPVAMNTGSDPAPELFFSLYVRNNMDDISILDTDATNGTFDEDMTIRLISVGWVRFGENEFNEPIIHAVKILEEEYTWVGVDQNPSAQKGKDGGNTGSGSYGRG